MNALGIAGALATGIALGLFFFGGLWFTVSRLATARHPAMLALASFWIRMLTATGVILLVVKQHWEYGLILILGFALGRVAISILLGDRKGCGAHRSRKQEQLRAALRFARISKEPRALPKCT